MKRLVSRLLPIAFLTATHMVPVIIVTVAHESIQELSTVAKILSLLVYIAIAIGIYWLLKRYADPDERAESERLRHQQEEIEKWRRYKLLQSQCLEVVSEFLKDRYKASHDFNKKLKALIDAGPVRARLVSELLQEFDGKRREQIKSALQNLSSFLPRDSFKKPEDADEIQKDIIKISFYAVEPDGDGGSLYLVRKWRYYPNEGEPRTPRFGKTDGAAGAAWSSKRIVICERGGEDPVFDDMWGDGRQKQEYASMICVPAIKDIPADGYNEVYGVLTVDSPIRRGYFETRIEQFWADLFHPICNMLIYCQESQDKQQLLIEAVSKLHPFETDHDQAMR